MYIPDNLPNEDDEKEMFFRPEQIDQFMQAFQVGSGAHYLQVCWMSLPKERRNLDELEKQFHRMVDRALEDFRADPTAFGK